MKLKLPHLQVLLIDFHFHLSHQGKVLGAVS